MFTSPKTSPSGSRLKGVFGAYVPRISLHTIDVIIVIGLASGACFLTLGAVKAFADNKPRCSDFTNWQDAQRAYNSDRVTYAHLDRDGDGIACQNLPKSTH